MTHANGHGPLARSTDAAAETALEARILEAPSDPVLVADYLDLLRRRFDNAAALEHLAAFQDRAGAPLAAVLWRLEEHLKNDGVRARFAQLFAEARDQPFYRACEDVWTAHGEGRRLNREACRTVATLDRDQAAGLYFSFIVPQPVQIAAKRYNAKQSRILSDAGVRIAELKAGIDAFLRFGSPEWEQVVTSARHRDEATAADIALKERLSSSKDRMVAERTLAFVDPLDGEWRRPYDSFLCSGKAIYAFAGQQPFHLIYAYYGLDPVGILLPGHRLILSLTHQTRGALMGEQIAAVQAAILTRMARTPDAYEAACEAPPFEGPREIVLVVGRTENFAHHLWNYYAAIERLAVSGAIENVDVVLSHGSQFFGPLSELFPELAGAAFHHEPPDHQDPRPFRRDSLVVPTGSMYVPSSLSRRVVATMRRRPSAPDVLEPTGVPERGPVIWFGMRLGDKSWIGQRHGIPTIIAAIAECYPDALFLLDGFSYPVGADRISDQWAPVIAELNETAEAVRSASPDPDRVLNLVGNSLRENVLWADATDVYLTPLGSTQHKVGWFSDAPGIAYAPPMYGGGLAERTVSNWGVEISAPVTWVIAEGVEPGKRRGARDSRTRMQNVELDVDAITERMLATLADRHAQRGWRRAELEVERIARGEPPRTPRRSLMRHRSSVGRRTWLGRLGSLLGMVGRLR